MNKKIILSLYILFSIIALGYFFHQGDVVAPKKDSLTIYRAKRKFKETPEPEKSTRKKHEKHIFVVQKHDASHLHYDFRLQIGHVLKSWAVPKGPPLKIGEKHLAVQTEDHPLDYATFEGTIPEGHYGAGTVEIYDTGKAYSIKKDAGKIASLKQSYEDGEIKIMLEGKKLTGPYVLVQTAMHGNDKNWLMLKMDPKKVEAE